MADLSTHSYTMATISHKDYQSKMNDEASSYEQRIRELKTRRNAHADVSSLPLELLVDIFLLVQKNTPLKDWHRITQVCRHWRDTAINTPILWTKPPVRHQDYTSLMLERSKTSNLYIFLASLVSTATLVSLSGHIGRIQTLTAFLPVEQLAELCDRFIASGHIFSQLESLDVDQSGWQAVDWILPSTLIRQASSLRSVQLSRVGFDWQMLAPLNLTSLRLNNIRLTEQISSRTLLDTLGQMPRLRHLAFDLKDLLLRSAPTRPASKFALSQLESLDVEDCSPPHIPFLISHLVLPRLNCLKIEMIGVQVVEAYSSNTLATITTTIANGNFCVSGSLSVQCGRIRISDSNESFVDIRLPGAYVDDHVIGYTRQLLTQIALTLHDLVQVTLVIPLNSDELVQIFGNMHRLKAVTIHLYGTLISALIGALTHFPGHDSPHGARLFSNLDTVGCNGFLWDEIDPSVVTDFCNAILQRANYATAMKTVYFNYRCPPKWAVKLLRDGGISVKNGEVPEEYGF
ncbi:hypothetical protein D9619_010085 [Psilocybe cf. subviscida]|uniref:F-box domain-containing protein n=1 Tax=Psilocybe cf. subviscida TaxID=2480587 RepID=A0A8H5BLH6_9AGAR|nr:hypothetical protein D9619_010085 [Psilocybe cf. subviscida]